MNKIISSIIVSSLLTSVCFAGEVLAVVNGKNITDEVAPKNFKTLDKDKQKEIVSKLIEKRLAGDYALGTDIVNTAKYKKVLEHILNPGKKGKDKNKTLANIVNKKEIKGYTQEQLNSKKGLLAFDFLLEDKANKLKVSDKVLKKYYDSVKYKYDTPARIELLNIVVEKEDLAKKIIEDIKKAKDSLKEFSVQAKKHSLAPSASNHGYFGKVALMNLNPTLKILEDKKRGYYSQTPIKTEFGYEVFYVLNDIPEYKSTFENEKDKIMEEYTKKTVKQWAMDKIKELKEKASIKLAK